LEATAHHRQPKFRELDHAPPMTVLQYSLAVQTKAQTPS
jgi:hypothetical protein